MNIIVKQKNILGYWYINLDKNLALFRFRNQKANDVIKDYSEKYDTIMDFLKYEINIRDVKEIIPHKKYVFSALHTMCSYKEVKSYGSESFHSNIVNCNNKAKIYSHVDGKPVCFHHASK
ncbi:MAG: hypothetical protein ACTHME_03350 [Candidatus Nitrosocosmicus sp.]